MPDDEVLAFLDEPGHLVRIATVDERRLAPRRAHVVPA